MKIMKVSRVLGAAMLCLGLLVSAGITMARQDQAMPAKEKKTTTISGTIAAVTDSAVTIIDSQKKEHTISVASDTKVTKAGKDATLADLKVNDAVTIEVKKGDGETWTAVKISVS
jgi:hypothetical protein